MGIPWKCGGTDYEAPGTEPSEIISTVERRRTRRAAAAAGGERRVPDGAVLKRSVVLGGEEATK